MECGLSLVCTLIYNNMCHHSGQNVVDSRGAQQQILTTVMTCIVVKKSTDHTKTTFRIVFHHNINVKQKVFFSEHKLKKASRDTLTRATLSGPLSAMAN